MPTVKKSVEINKAKVVSQKTAMSSADSLATTAKKGRSQKAVDGSGVNLSVDVYTLTGVKSGTFALPKEVFGAKVNKDLLTQALRIYQSNNAGHFGHTKTRGEVDKSTRKIYKQKGTGGARHGAKSAPIFVGGGIAFGPRKRLVRLELPQKMKSAALISALSAKTYDSEVAVVDGLDAATGKTKQMAAWLKSFDKKSVLFVGEGEGLEKVRRAIGNLQAIKYVDADSINVLNVLQNRSLVLTKNAVSKISDRLYKKGSKLVSD